MKGNISKHFKRAWKEYVCVGIIIVSMCLLLTYAFGLYNADLSYPMNYGGGDEMSQLMISKMLTQQNWSLSTDRLGTPGSAEFYDFSANMLHNVETIITKFFAMVTGSAPMALNLTFLSMFIMSALISYFVMRELKIKNWISVICSLAYGMTPYALMRNIHHQVLAECYFIPLSILICIWIYEREDILNFDKSFFKNPRNYLVFIFTILIANNGIAYYPFFTCFLLVVTAISKVAKTGKFKYAVKCIVTIASICFFVVLAMLPGIVYHMKNGVNPLAVVRGGPGESEIYGLKIIQLLLPINSHGNSLVDKIINGYNTSTEYLNENITSYIGVLSVIGFVILMIVLFMRKNNQKMLRLGFLSEMNLMLILLGTIGGFSAIFSLLVSDMLRAYNRISIVICYVCLLAFAIVADTFFDSRRMKKANRYVSLGLAGLTVFVGLFAIWEGIPESSVPDYEAIKAAYDSDDEFVKRIEGSVPEGAKIFTLPYHEYPEGGDENAMEDYHLFIGFIHSDKLKWSYGCIKGRDGDDWYKTMASYKEPKMVEELKAAGFSGIYIDRRAYTEDDLTELESNLEAATGNTFIESNNKNLSFISFK
ncbi:MAG: hypothetical protein Q4F06_02970 [Eubacteriales bacterium]|nr:hypothetical protein [Eubacteriales bacterium]